MTRIGEGVTIVSQTSKAFAAVSDNSEKVGGLIGEIAGASSEKTQGIGQINSAVSEMSSVTQQNAAIAKESASASEEIHMEINAMKKEIEGLVVLVDTQDNRRQAETPAPPAALSARSSNANPSPLHLPVAGP